MKDNTRLELPIDKKCQGAKGYVPVSREEEGSDQEHPSSQAAFYLNHTQLFSNAVMSNQEECLAMLTQTRSACPRSRRSVGRMAG